MPNSYRIFQEERYAYFVTCTIVEWLPVFTTDAYCQIILDSLAYVRKHKMTQLNAYVLMPTHLHAVLWPQDGTSLSNVLRDFKRFTSRAISNEAQKQNDDRFLEIFTQARQMGRSTDVSDYQVWQEGSHPEAIYTRDFAQQKIDYIHKNPIRAGLAQSILDWPYTSAHAYYSEIQSYPQIDMIEM